MTITKEELEAALTDYFGINQKGGSYTYELTIAKESVPGRRFKPEHFRGFNNKDVEELTNFLVMALDLEKNK